MQAPSGKRPRFEMPGHGQAERAPQRTGELERPSPSIPPELGAEDTKAFNVLVGEGIRRARQQLGWTQAVLAETAGLSPNYIARLERGELGPSFFVANRICAAMSIDLESLVAAGGQPTVRRSTTKKKIAG